MVNNDAAYLPPEIMEKILSRLPAKSLLRFKGVCRAWNALVSSNPFIRTHLLHSTSSPALLIRDKRHVLRFQNREFRIDNPPEYLEFTKILCSCNGVLLLQGISKLDLVLWNPSIRKIIRLRFPFRSRNLYRGVVKHGLCYDPATDDLKVVVMYWDNYAVYSHKNKSWTNNHPVIGDGLTNYNFLLYSSTVSRGVACVDGAVYWICSCGDLLCFESDGDKLKTVKKPRELEKRGHDFPLFTLRGRLCIWFYCSGESVARIWMREDGGGWSWMREDGGGWREIMRFEDVPHPCDLKRPSYVGENEIMVYLGLPRLRVMVYHPREKTYEQFNLPQTEYSEPRDVFSSVDTLLLLDQLPRRSNRKRRRLTC